MPMGLIDEYKSLVEDFIKRELAPYIERLRANPPPKRIKEINDAVWQTVSLQPLEVLVLDSPLLQRLRRISQLGVARWVYPSAGHSRLEHSIGALSQVQRIIDSIQRQDRKSRADGVIDDSLVNVLRLAALCHDVGHGFMSHVVENALSANGAIADLSFELTRKFDKDRIQLSEAAAYYMLGSPAFRELLEQARKICHEHALPDRPHEMIQNAVVGKLVDGRYPLIQELISGPFDADKLDYLPRDAHMAGVPIVTDIPRLIQKIRLVAVGKEQLPAEIKTQLSEHHPSYLIQAVAISGARTLDELTLGKTLLYDKIYRHQKVRAAEAMIAKIVDLLIGLVPAKAAILPLLLDDAELLGFERSTIEKRLGSMSDDQWSKLEPALGICQRLQERRIFVRAYAFASTMPGDPFRYDVEQRSGIERLDREVRQPEKRTELLAAIISELERMKVTCPDSFPKAGDLHMLVALDPAPTPSGTSEISRAYLVAEKDLLSKFRDDFPEASPWSNAYLMTRDVGYLFSGDEIATHAFLATEAVVRKRYGVRTPDSAITYSKADRKRLDDLRRELSSGGYYDTLPRDLRAVPERLTKLDVKEVVEDFVRRLGPFDGAPLRARSPGLASGRVTSDRVHAWLRQFGTDTETDGALDLLRRLKLVTRSDVVQSVERFLAAHPEFKGASVCPFGAPKDSSSVLTYYIQDLAPQFELRVESLEQALTYGERPILFVDDLIGSGGQSQSVVAGWFGEQGPLDEDHGLPLSDFAQKALISRKVAFLFLFGEVSGKSALQAASTKHNLNAVVELADPNPPPRAFTGPGEFQERCRDLGFQLLAGYGGKERSDDWRKERALGYGNQGYLLAFPYNTPTQSLTLLWCSGKADGEDWLPLVPRRRKT